MTGISRDKPSSNSKTETSENKNDRENASWGTLDNLKHPIQQVWGCAGPTARRIILTKGTEEWSVFSSLTVCRVLRSDRLRLG